MTCKEIQKGELAGKTKLTAVTFGHGRHRVQAFVMVHHSSEGRAVLGFEQMNQLVQSLNLRRGDTFTSG